MNSDAEGDISQKKFFLCPLPLRSGLFKKAIRRSDEKKICHFNYNTKLRGRGNKFLISLVYIAYDIYIKNFSFFEFFPGYDRSIPGIPRYTILGSDNSGNFSLRIANVTVEDDADFECQVRKNKSKFKLFFKTKLTYVEFGFNFRSAPPTLTCPSARLPTSTSRVSYLTESNRASRDELTTLVFPNCSIQIDPPPPSKNACSA